jgi:hypothetical protein
MTSAGKHLSLRKVVEAFVSGNYDTGSNSNESLYFSGDVLYSYGSHFPLLVRKGNYFLRNIDSYSSTTAKHQSYAGAQVPSYWLCDVSMDKLEEAGISYVTVEVVDHAGEDTLLRYRDKYYLTGLIRDAKSLRDYYVVELDQKLIDKVEAVTVEEAIESLKPQAVLDAELANREVLRTGEFFFILNLSTSEGNIPTVDKMLKVEGSPNTLQKNAYIEGSNHYVTNLADFRDGKGNGKLFAKGQVKHKNSQNRILKLKDWYEVHKNTGVQSW